MLLLQMAWLQMGVKMATTMVGSFFATFLWDLLHQRRASLFQVWIVFSCILMKIINKGRVFSAPPEMSIALYQTEICCILFLFCCSMGYGRGIFISNSQQFQFPVKLTNLGPICLAFCEIIFCLKQKKI
jgi:hypothetical protein